MSSEELLRSTLREKAMAASAGLTLDDIRRSAQEVRHGRRQRAAIMLAAAAVVAVAVPAALLLRPVDEPSPAPSPSPSLTTTPSPTPTPTPSETPSATPAMPGLESIARGPDIAVPWIGDGVIHVPDGPTVPVPAGTWESFTSYHGGWLLAGSNALVQVDAQGRVADLGQGGSRIAVSGDGMQTAFLLDGELRVGIASGMGEGESAEPVTSPGEAGPVGFLSSGRVVFNGSKGQILILHRQGGPAQVTGLGSATGSTQFGDLVAGRSVDDDGARVVSVPTGRILWTKSGWLPGQFSPDGRYLAAYRSATGGEFETVAILDARSGDVVATSKTPGIQALPAVPPAAWEDDAHLLIPYRGGSSWAVLRLSTEGTVSRASEVVQSPAGSIPFVLSARP